MTKSNITTIYTAASPQQSVTLESLLQSLEEWRKHKEPGEKVPTKIWDQVFILIEQMPHSKVLNKAGISTSQFRKAQELRRSQIQAEGTQKNIASTAKSQNQNVDFCTVAQDSLDYKPAKAFTTTTSVVELYRADGALMKIHMCTDRFAELLQAFFKG